MSMLTRKGTMIRKNRESLRRSMRRPPGSAGSLRRTHQSMHGSHTPVRASVVVDAEGQATSPVALAAVQAFSETTPRTSAKFHDSPAGQQFRTMSLKYINEQNLSNQQIRNTSIKSKSSHEEYPPVSVVYKTDLRNDYSLDQPSYGSIVSQIKEATTENDGTCAFLCKAFEIIHSSILITVLLGMLMGIPVAMVSVGVKYLHECPREPRIPIYLLVGGCFGLVKLLSLLWQQIRSRQYERLDDYGDEADENGLGSKSSGFSDSVLSLFLLIWFSFGNYWVFAIWPPNYEQLLYDPNNWCDMTCYVFACLQILACYCIFAAFLFLSFVLMLCHACSKCCKTKS